MNSIMRNLLTIREIQTELQYGWQAGAHFAGVKAQTMNYTAEVFASRVLSGEGKEGLSSFVEKRNPKWSSE